MNQETTQPETASVSPEVGALCLECGEPVERNKENLFLGVTDDMATQEDEVWIHKACASKLRERLEMVANGPVSSA